MVVGLDAPILGAAAAGLPDAGVRDRAGLRGIERGVAGIGAEAVSRPWGFVLQLDWQHAGDRNVPVDPEEVSDLA